MLLTLLMKMSLPMPSYCFCLQSIYEQEKKIKQKKTTYFNIIVIHEVIFLVVSGPGPVSTGPGSGRVLTFFMVNGLGRAGPGRLTGRAGPGRNFWARAGVYSGIMTVNSPTGSTLQCDMWLWDDVPLNSPGGNTLQCGRWLWDDMLWNSPNVRHVGILHLVSILNISPQSTVLQNFIQIRPLSAEKMTLCRLS